MGTTRRCFCLRSDFGYYPFTNLKRAEDGAYVPVAPLSLQRGMEFEAVHIPNLSHWFRTNGALVKFNMAHPETRAFVEGSGFSNLASYLFVLPRTVLEEVEP